MHCSRSYIYQTNTRLSCMYLIKRIPIVFLLCLWMGVSSAQEHAFVRQRVIAFPEDTLRIDTLSIVPGSLLINGLAPDTRAWYIDYAGSRISAPRSKSLKDSIRISYRVLPFDFTKSRFHKDPSKVARNEQGILNPFLLPVEEEPNTLFKFGGLNKSGSISRGISMGNNQDVVLNSSLNLQMNGRISENVEVLAAITDENIPFQPEGNTQNLQEFDKVFIQLSSKQQKLIAGDYDLRRPNSYFMNFYKRAQGGSFSSISHFALKNEAQLLGESRSSVSIAVSKGRFARNTIQGVEGNQGPYRLTGSNNELFIMVLSGSEKVYINGILLERGAQSDYVIDYNTAQLSFTTKKQITKDSRIVVEFQYSDRNYLRSLVHINQEADLKNWKFRFNFFGEQDSKNQPLQQELNDSQKSFMSGLGDSLQLAVLPNIQSVVFDPNEVLYKRIDSLDVLTGIVFKDVYVYSTASDSAHYRLGFSFVGQGKGNYEPANTAANGKVFRWVMPRNGLPVGSYEPIQQLITPKRQQLYTFAVDRMLAKGLWISSETALSNLDRNTFATFDKQDNVGMAEKFILRKSTKLSTDSLGWMLNTTVDYEYVQHLFNPLERFRNVEFERDWNLGTQAVSGDEHLAGGLLELSRKRTGFINYQFRRYQRANSMHGFSNGMKTDYRLLTLHLVADASLTKSEFLARTGDFLRQHADLSKAFKHVVVGVKEAQEDNRFHGVTADSLSIGSYAFEEWEGYLQNPDTAVNRYRIFYGQRFDHLLKNGALRLSSVADQCGASAGFNRHPNNRLIMTGVYRKLAVSDSSLSTLHPSNTFITSMDHDLMLAKGALHFTTYYEVGTGQELKKEFAYLEVPVGQGTYAWNDYNGNGIKELDEFDVAANPDQARYMKVLVPTNEYIRTNSNQLSEVFLFTPASLFDNAKGFKKFVSRFSNQLLFRNERKVTDDGFAAMVNPFRNQSSDSVVSLNSTLQEQVYFNRSSSVFGFNAGVQKNNARSLLTNGIETRGLEEQTIEMRGNFSRAYGITFAYRSGIKTNASEFFASRDYRVVYNRTEPRFIFQPTSSFRIIVSYEYSHKRNLLGLLGELADQQKAGTELKYSMPKQGVFAARFNYIFIDYNATDNSPVAYEMLDGLKKGENYTWAMSIQRTLSSGLQLSLNYDGRKPASNAAIHTGGVSLRAYF